MLNQIPETRVGGHMSSHQWDTHLPMLATWYRVPHSLRGRDVWFLDPDLFLEGTEGLGLGVQTKRALEECLNAYRRGLYLAAANLAGSVSEGAWYAAAKTLADENEWAKMEDTGAAKLQTWVGNRLRQYRDTKFIADELVAQANVLREIRNYGVHPGPPMGDLEKYFNQTECCMLLLSLHRYLVRLADACSLVKSLSP